MPCLEIKPFPVCGLNGECDKVINASTEDESAVFCACDEGWSQTLEFAYFNPNGDIRSGMCLYNTTIIDFTLYGILLILSMFALVSMGCVMETKRQLLRQIPNIATLIIFIVLAIYRLSNPAEALLGEDIFFSVLISLSFGIYHVAEVIFYNKYVSYMLRKIEFMDKAKYQQPGQILKMVNLFKLGIEILAVQLLWIICITDRKTALTMLYIFFSIELLGSTYVVVLALVSIGKITNDMNAFISNRQRNQYSTNTDNMTKWIQMMLPKLNQVRNSAAIIRVLSSLLFALTLASEMFFQMWIYFLPLIIIGATSFDILIVRNHMSKKRSAKYKNALESKESTGSYTGSSNVVGFSRSNVRSMI